MTLVFTMRPTRSPPPILRPRYLKAHPRFEGRLVSAIGLRRDESAARAKRVPWKRNDRNSRAGREWFDWLPVFALTTQDVFRVIAEAGQKPHWVYSQGISRCSCTFCIFGSRADLRRAAELRPGLYARYTQLEQRIGHTLSPFPRGSSSVDGHSGRSRRGGLSPVRRRPLRP